jgi:hypothetical protein
MTAQAKLLDSHGNTIALSDQVVIPSGRFGIFDFYRDSINLAGEPATGRLDMRAILTLTGSEMTFPPNVTLEIVDAATGSSSIVEPAVIVYHGRNLPLPNSEDVRLSDEASQSIGTVETALIGLAPGDQLRVTGIHSAIEGCANCANNLKQMTLAVHNQNGDVIIQSGVIAIEPGQFISFQIDRNDLPIAGDPGTGRLQLRVEIRSEFTADSQTIPVITPASLEIVNRETGKTALIPAIQKVNATAVHLK